MSAEAKLAPRLTASCDNEEREVICIVGFGDVLRRAVGSGLRTHGSRSAEVAVQSSSCGNIANTPTRG